MQLLLFFFWRGWKKHWFSGLHVLHGHIVSNSVELARQLSFSEFRWCGRWSFLFILTELQIVSVTVIVSQVAQFNVSSCLYACHSWRNCTSCTCLPVLLSFFFFSFFLFFFLNAGCQNNIMLCHMWLLCNKENLFFRTVYLVRHPYVSARIPICVWFCLHVVYQIWQKYTSTGTCCLFPIQHHSSRKEINYYLLTSNIKVANCLWKLNPKGDLISHLKISNSEFFFSSSLCISLQLLFTHHSPDPRLEATTKAGSSGITDERRWTVSGKVLWKTFNVFYISVSELSRNTWITQCQPNTA